MQVQAGVEVVKDKQEILEAQLQLSQVQISKPEQPPEPQFSGHMGSLQQQQQQQQQVASPAPATLPNAPAPPNLAPPVHHPAQFPPNIMPMPQHDPYYPPPVQTSEPQLPTPQHYQPTPPKLSPPSPQPQYQYSQPPPMSLQHPNPNPTQSQPPMGHHSEEPPYLPPPQSYTPSFRQPGPPGPPPQFHNNPSQMYEPPPPTGRFPGQYGPSAYSYNDSQYGSSGSPVKSQPGGGSGFSQLPTARILPQAVPTAVAAGGGSSGGSGSGGNRVPIDDVVDKVTSMGFPREQVRATVRKLTENGQAVDLNVVLDKLMTDGVESQGPRPWFGR